MKLHSVKKAINNLTLETIQAMTRDSYLDKHFGYTSNEVVSDSDLIHRVSKMNKKAATAFTCGRNTVLELIKLALEEDIDYISSWTEDMSDGDDWVVEKEFDSVIGKGFFKTKEHEWNAGAAPCSAIRIVLRKTNDSNEFRIVSVYPIQTEEDKDKMINAGEIYRACNAIAI